VCVFDADSARQNLADRPASAAATRDRLLAVLAEPLRPTG